MVGATVGKEAAGLELLNCKNAGAQIVGKLQNLPLEQQKTLYCHFSHVQHGLPKDLSTLRCGKLAELPFK